jgi:pimeloyl-ACP methyl ester carboxylesterase
LQELINGLQMHWREDGSGDAVLFLHAFPFHSAMWEDQLRALPAGWRGIAPDLRGFGRTHSAGEDPYTMAVFADDVAALLNHLKISSAVVCGLSMGGYVAFELYRRHRNKVRALILCNTRAGADNDAAKQARLQLAARARKEGVRAVVDTMLPKLVSDNTRKHSPDVVVQAQQIMSSNHAESMARALEGMAGRANSEDLLRDLQQPVMVVHGDEDAVVPRGEAQMMARAIRGARIHILPEIGHLSNLEDPTEFNRFLSEFLVQLPPSRTLKLA